jgi:hypothetical protein
MKNLYNTKAPKLGALFKVTTRGLKSIVQTEVLLIFRIRFPGFPANFKCE